MTREHQGPLREAWCVHAATCSLPTPGSSCIICNIIHKCIRVGCVASSFTSTPYSLDLSLRCRRGSRASRGQEAGKGAGDTCGARFAGSSAASQPRSSRDIDPPSFPAMVNARLRGGLEEKAGEDAGMASGKEWVWSKRLQVLLNEAAVALETKRAAAEGRCAQARASVRSRTRPVPELARSERTRRFAGMRTPTCGRRAAEGPGPQQASRVPGNGNTLPKPKPGRVQVSARQRRGTERHLRRSYRGPSRGRRALSRAARTRAGRGLGPRPLHPGLRPVQRGLPRSRYHGSRALPPGPAASAVSPR